MVGSTEEARLKAILEMDGKQPLKLVDDLVKRIDELKKLSANALKIGFPKDSQRDLKESLKAFQSLSREMEALSGKGYTGGISGLNSIKKQFRDLADALGPVKTSLKEINRTLASVRTSFAGTDALFQKSRFSGLKDNLLFGTSQGQQFQELKLYYDQAIKIPQQIEKMAQALNEKLKPELKEQRKATEEATRIQDSYNKRLEYVNKILPTVQLNIMANYAAINKIVSGFKYLLNYTVRYDEELHQLQAISGTTTGTLNNMREAIESVAATTEFTSLELSKAATVLAQAGLSATQIEGTLPAIAKLATATGTDLNTSVETITSTLNIYNLQTSEAEHVTNALTTAMNESKANIGGFQQAIQYAGNLASQLGISFDETAAAISAAAQAGIRSKSMLGTGFRATLTEMLKPTKKFKDQLESVGLTIEDIDVKSKGYVNVLKTLKEAGFGAEEAFRGLDRRAAAFLVTQINQVDFMQNLRSEMAGSTAAIKANDIQMESLAKQYKTFQNNIANAATDGLEPFTRLLSNLLSLINNFMSNKTVRDVIGTVLTGAGVFGGLKTIQMMSSAWKVIIDGLKIASGSGIVQLVTLIKETSSNSGRIIGVLSALKVFFTSNLGIAAIAALVSGIYALGNAFDWWTSNTTKAKEALEKAKGEAEEARNKFSGVQTLLQRVYDQREKLQDQSERDIFVREIITKYPEITKYIDNVTMSYSELIEMIKKLNTLSKGEEAVKAAKEAEATLKNEKINVKEAGKSITEEGLYQFLSRTRLPGVDKFGDNLSLTASFAVANIKKGNLTKYNQLPQANTREISLALADWIKNNLDEAKKESKDKLVVAMGQTINEAFLSKDEGIIALVKSITDRYKKQIIAEDTKQEYIQKQVSDYARENLQSMKDFSQVITNASQTLDSYNEQVKQTGQSIIDLSGLLSELKEIYNQSSFKYDKSTGELRPYGSYSVQEAANMLTGGNIEELKNLFNKYLEGLGKQNEINNKTFEELFSIYSSGFLESNEVLSEKLDMLSGAIIALERAIEEGGSGGYSGSPRKIFEQARSFAGKKSNFNKSKKDSSTKSLNEQLNAAVYATAAGINSKYGLDLPKKTSLFDESGKLKSEEEFLSSWKDSFIEVGLSGKALEKEVSNMGNAFNTASSILEQKTKHFTGSLDKSGPKFDTAAASMNKFFKDLDANINKVETTFINAERALNQELAIQQGKIRGVGLAYGKNSVLNQYEQNVAQNLEDSQIPFRLANLRQKRQGYIDALDTLRGSGTYKDVTERYKAAEARYDSAVARGSWNEAREANRIMKELGSAYKKYTDEEKKLTSNVAQLDESITSLDTTLKEREALEGKGAGEQILYGMKAAGSNYFQQQKDSGFLSMAGSVGYMTAQGIDALDSNMTNMFQNILEGSQRAGDAFKEFGRSVIKTIRDVAVQMAVKQGLSALFGAFGMGTTTTDTGSNSWLFGGTGVGEFAVGGLINGPVKNRDSVPTMLMPGEYVLKKSAVDTIGRDYLDNLNANASATMNEADQYIGESKTNNSGQGSGVGGTVNVYVVGQEQQQSMTPNDVVVTITQDMIKGGQTKKLVKSIAMGTI